jgi:O-methyltransferase
MNRNIMQLQSLYVDLMIRILTNQIYQDGQINPHIAPEFDASRREVGGDWPQVAHTMVGRKRLENLADLTCRVLEERIPGDLIETGVWRGGCCILMRSILAAYGDVQRRVYVADSFEGLPKPKDEVYEADRDDIHHTYSELVVSEEQVRENFRRYGLLDGQVVFLKGFFDATLPTLKGNTFSLLRLDGDMYESTICALTELYPLLSPGGYIIIDDYGAVPGCRQAVEDYRAQMRISEPLTEVDWTGMWWRKAKGWPLAR